MIITQDQHHVTDKNMKDVIDITDIIDQFSMSHDGIQTLDNSIHIQHCKLVINLLSRDLRHKLNTIRYKPKEKRPDFAYIPVNTILGQSRLDKLDHIRYLYLSLLDFQDLNWMFHDKQVTMIVEFKSIDLVQ